MNEVTLSCLHPRDEAVVQGIGLYGGMRRRLRDLGMVSGTKVVCACVAPSGSPMAFWLKGALIALRLEDCRRIRVKRCE